MTPEEQKAYLERMFGRPEECHYWLDEGDHFWAVNYGSGKYSCRNCGVLEEVWKCRVDGTDIRSL